MGNIESLTDRKPKIVKDETIRTKTLAFGDVSVTVRKENGRVGYIKIYSPVTGGETFYRNHNEGFSMEEKLEQLKLELVKRKEDVLDKARCFDIAIKEVQEGD